MTLRTAGVLGLGLIGGSVLRALAGAGLTVRGYDADPATRASARAAGSAGGLFEPAGARSGGLFEPARSAGSGGWQVVDEPGAAVAGADLVVLAVPLPALDVVLPVLAGHPGLVTDVVSVKLPVLHAVRGALPGVRYLGGHPMAGREDSGFAASDARLFDGCSWVLTLADPDTGPDRGTGGWAGAESGTGGRGGQGRVGTDLADWLALAELITRLGARAVPATAAEHDAAVARISHVPHLVAAALAASAGSPLAASLAAGSFRDGTRVAASRPLLSAAMCGGNAGPVREALDELLADLEEARALLSGPYPVGALTGWFGRGHAVRSGWPPATGRTVDLPATRAALLDLGRAGGWVTDVEPDNTSVTAHYPTIVTDPN
jgi:prephenate dehydrogenase